IDYLVRLMEAPLREAEVFSSPRDVIRARRDCDPVCRLLHRVDTARSNKRILLRTGVEGGRCFPLFDTLGTVTGRIMVVDPHLQHISKKYRAIISASPGHTLVYLDYS